MCYFIYVCICIHTYIEKRKEKWVGLGLDTYKWLISEQGEKKKAQYHLPSGKCKSKSRDTLPLSEWLLSKR